MKCALVLSKNISLKIQNAFLPTMLFLLFTNVTSPVTCDSIPLLILIVFHEVRHPLLRFTPLCHPPFPSFVQCPLSPPLPSPCSPLLPSCGNLWPPDGNTGVGNLSRRPAGNFERSKEAVTRPSSSAPPKPPTSSGKLVPLCARPT